MSGSVLPRGLERRRPSRRLNAREKHRENTFALYAA
jgi:hypothetical protein